MQKYEILSAIGEGAYGVVLKCKDIENKSFVAIKKFKQTDEQEHTRKTTMRQIKILKLVNHPNIIIMKQAFRKKGIVYLVFQYVQNNLLEVLQKSQNGLKMQIIRKLMYQLVKGLAYLHEQNIVHRDVKPQNLLVNLNYHLKICDFGFARQFKPTQKEGEITDYVATRWYRPPELLVGGQYGKQIDMWAVACIMCELIDGNPLFAGENQLDQLFLIQKTLGALPSELNQRFLKNQRYLGMKFPEIHNLDKLQKKYFGKICQKGMSLIKSLLKMNPKQRMTANEALRHPFFEGEAEAQRMQTQNDKMSKSRKQTYTSISTTNRKDPDSQSQINRCSKYGKIYKRTNNIEAISNIYQSSHNCQINGIASKSLGKQSKKLIYNNQLSLEKHHNKDVFLKTEAKGFYICSGQQKIQGYGDLQKKVTQVGTAVSNQQLPLLLYSQQIFTEDTCRKTIISNKKKAFQVVGQKQPANFKQSSSNNK